MLQKMEEEVGTLFAMKDVEDGFKTFFQRMNKTKQNIIS